MHEAGDRWERVGKQTAVLKGGCLFLSVANPESANHRASVCVDWFGRIPAKGGTGKHSPLDHVSVDGEAGPSPTIPSLQGQGQEHLPVQ